MAQEPQEVKPSNDVPTSGTEGDRADFNTRYGALVKDVFTEIVNQALAKGESPDAQARIYAELGKPDFTLAYLVAAALPDGEKRDLLAAAYERRAVYTEEKAREFDRRFHRPFPLLFTEASKDRATAKQIRAGRRIRPAADKQLPMV